MNKYALITDGSRGLGAQLVPRFWLEGYSLIVVSRNFDSIKVILDELPQRINQVAIPIAFYLSKISEISDLLIKIKSSIPHLSILINNAAIHGPIGNLTDNETALWQKTLDVNLLAPVLLCKGLIPLLKKNSGSSIINLSGGGATGPRKNFSAYSTAKTGLVRFSETLALELISKGIRVNCIAPGAMKTDLLKEVLINGEAAGIHEVSIANDVFLNGGASFDRVVELAIFLASNESYGINGKLISAVWDNWMELQDHLQEICNSDVFTLRRITAKDRKFNWGDI